ncbi:MAG: hypothetical protein FJ333_08495 [Sphingomonadales bacterium]|nr:hypothetical protein [Sphingomonadales bacterium]
MAVPRSNEAIQIATTETRTQPTSIASLETVTEEQAENIRVSLLSDISLNHSVGRNTQAVSSDSPESNPVNGPAVNPIFAVPETTPTLQIKSLSNPSVDSSTEASSPVLSDPQSIRMDLDSEPDSKLDWRAYTF